jgi:hypothetical protein
MTEIAEEQTSQARLKFTQPPDDNRAQYLNAGTVGVGTDGQFTKSGWLHVFKQAKEV